MTLLVGSLFSGIGGMDAGLARAGFGHAFFCESDPYRREVLAARWPGVPVFDDVRDLRRGRGIEPQPLGRAGQADSPDDGDGSGAELVGGRRLAWHDARIDLLCGGFPCQDLSVAGRRAGLAGGRSGLFFEFARLIDAFRPRWVLVENVPGLLSSNGGRDFGVVLESLAELGYGVAWRVLDSRFFGVPQRRRRVFIVGAVADGDPRAAAERAGEILAVGSRCPGHPATRTDAREDAAAASTVSTLAGSGKSGGWRVGADEAAGGQLVPAYAIQERAVSENPDAGPQGAGWKEEEAYTLEARHHVQMVAAPLTKGSATGEGVNAPERRQEDDVNIVSYALNAKRGNRDDGESETFVPATAGVRRLTPTECERLQGLPDGWTQLGGHARLKAVQRPRRRRDRERGRVDRRTACDGACGMSEGLRSTPPGSLCAAPDRALYFETPTPDDSEWCKAFWRLHLDFANTTKTNQKTINTLRVELMIARDKLEHAERKLAGEWPYDGSET